MKSQSKLDEISVGTDKHGLAVKLIGRLET